MVSVPLHVASAVRVWNALSFSCNCRQQYFERRALVRLRVHPDVAAALLDESVYRGQPEPGPLAWCFRCVERFEQVTAHLFGHARACVRDGQLDEVSGHNRRQSGYAGARTDVRRRDGQGSTVWHRVPRVHHQVQNDLVNMPGVGAYQSQRRVKMRDELNVLANQVANHVNVVREQCGQVAQLRAGKTCGGRRRTAVASGRLLFRRPSGSRSGSSAPNPKDSYPAKHRYNPR